MRPVLNNLSIEYLPVEALSPYAGNARCHPNDQIKQLATSYDEFGMIAPMIVDENLEIIAGHARLEAAKRRGMATVPAVRIAHLTAAQKKAYRLADNKIALNAGWDLDLLALELKALLDLDFDLGATGFEPAEVDLTFEKASVKTPKRGVSDDLVPEVSVAPPVSRPGDIWVMEGHRLICGDARESLIYGALLDGERADAVFTDPPYNVSIEGLVGLGSVKHAEFAMASGEMTEQQFTAFLAAFLRGAVAHCRDGAILFTCMDWRHMGEMLAAGHEVALELKNLCVWNKDNGGMGSFYRSKHELVFVWKHGTAPHTNTFKLGQHGRYRTNVWDYPGVNSLKPERMDELAMHPTVKPVALVADAILDVSKRRDIILDPFCGSGTTIIAAEKTGRHARAIELEPKYVDVAVRRWERFTGKPAVLAATGQVFAEVAEERRPANDNLLATEEVA